MRRPNFQPQPRTLQRLTDVSVNINNEWNFYTLNDLQFIKLNESCEYSELKYQTGLLREKETNPDNVVYVGYPGDYLFRDSSGTLTIIKRQDVGKYVKIFKPRRVSNPRLPRI